MLNLLLSLRFGYYSYFPSRPCCIDSEYKRSTVSQPRDTTDNLGVADAHDSERVSLRLGPRGVLSVSKKPASETVSSALMLGLWSSSEGTSVAVGHLEAAAEARCAAICGDTHTPLSFALADMRAATFIESPYRQ